MVNDYCITRELEHNVNNGEDKEGKFQPIINLPIMTFYTLLITFLERNSLSFYHYYSDA